MNYCFQHSHNIWSILRISQAAQVTGNSDQSHHLSPRDRVGSQQAATSTSAQSSSDLESYPSRTHNEGPIGQVYKVGIINLSIGDEGGFCMGTLHCKRPVISGNISVGARLDCAADLVPWSVYWHAMVCIGGEPLE